MKSRKLHILFVTPSLGTGGAEKQLLHLANSLPREIYKVSIVAMRKNGDYEAHVNGDVERIWATSRFKSSSLSALAGIRDVRQTIANCKPDLVVTFLNHMSLIAWVSSLGLGKIRRCVCIQNNVTEEARGAFGRLASKPYLTVLGRAASSSAGIVFISQGVQASFKSEIGLASDVPIAVINNIGVLWDNPKTQNQVQKDDPPVILACGRLHPQKDYPTLLKAFKIVRSTIKCRLRILGDGPQRNNLQNMIVDLGLKDSVELCGFQRSPATFMEKASLFVLSSKYEGFGNVIVEAMGQGLPVVSTNCPHGPSEIIQDNVTGLLVDVGSHIQLATAMSKVLEQPELNSRLSRAARKRAADFSIDAIVPRYSEFFQSICR